MSIRILGKDAPVRPIDWRKAGAQEESPQPATLPPSPSPASPQSPSPAEVELASLRESLPREVQAARQAGFQAGQSAAEQQFQDRYNAVILKLVRSIEEIASHRARLRRQAEEDVVRLALAIARRILHREITVDPHALQGLVKAALQSLEAREICAVRVHPSLLADLQRAEEQVGAEQSWNWTPDPSLEIGAVLVDTTRGQLDASIATQLEEIERGFADFLPART